MIHTHAIIVRYQQLISVTFSVTAQDACSAKRQANQYESGLKDSDLRGSFPLTQKDLRALFIALPGLSEVHFGVPITPRRHNAYSIYMIITVTTPRTIKLDQEICPAWLPQTGVSS